MASLIFIRTLPCSFYVEFNRKATKHFADFWSYLGPIDYCISLAILQVNVIISQLQTTSRKLKP